MNNEKTFLDYLDENGVMWHFKCSRCAAAESIKMANPVGDFKGWRELDGDWICPRHTITVSP